MNWFLRVKRVEPSYWEMTPEQRFEWVREMLVGFSPNDELKDEIE